MWKFFDEDMWDFWKMYDDVIDGVRMIVKIGLIDCDWIVIMGGLFGGYLVFCGVVYEEGFYWCVIMMVGVFDWECVMKDVCGSEYVCGWYGVLCRKLGDLKKN